MALMLLQADRPAVTKLLARSFDYFAVVRLHVISRMEYEEGPEQNALFLPTVPFFWFSYQRQKRSFRNTT